MLQSFDLAAERAFYVRHLQEVLLPFWLRRSIDEEYGGFLTCFDNEGRELLSHDKFTWSQGRITWVWAKLAATDVFTAGERDTFRGLAQSGANFLMQHCLLPNGHCVFLMERDGRPKVQAPGMPLDSSIYADCFVVLGLARYAAVSQERAPLDFAQRLYGSIVARIGSGNYPTEPYPIPPGLSVHGIPMILLNTSQELAAGLAAFGMMEAAGLVNSAAGCYLSQIFDRFVSPDGVVHEMVDDGSGALSNTLLTRYVNPGHAIEDMWFVMHEAQRTGDDTRIPLAGQVVKRAFQNGWDPEHGGLLLFADQEGGPPRGSVAGIEGEKMLQKVLADWGSKLWWVHSEALYTTLLAYKLTGDAEFIDLYRQVRDYTFSTFPHPDPAIGEWIQIRDRQGRPEQRVVALPVKDPFHIIRNVALIIDLLAPTE